MCALQLIEQRQSLSCPFTYQFHLQLEVCFSALFFLVCYNHLDSCMIRISRGTVELTFKCRSKMVQCFIAPCSDTIQRHFLQMIVNCALAPMTSDEAEMIVLVWFLLLTNTTQLCKQVCGVRTTKLKAIDVSSILCQTL